MQVNAPYVCHGIRFYLPFNPGFDKRDRFRLERSISAFDYVFDDDLILYLDNEEIKKLEDEYEAITQDEFEAALATLMLQVTDFSKKPLTLKKKMGEEYEKKILGILSHQERKNKDIPEEN